MAVYYYKLFDRLSVLKITQKELTQRIGASSATIAKMKNNQIVSLDILVRICSKLNCDIGDIVTCKPRPIGVEITNNNLDNLNAVARTSLKELMENKNLSTGDVAKITSLSRNTVKSFLSGNIISASSHIKLLRLGEQYNESLGNAYASMLVP